MITDSRVLELLDYLYYVGEARKRDLMDPDSDVPYYSHDELEEAEYSGYIDMDKTWVYITGRGLEMLEDDNGSIES